MYDDRVSGLIVEDLTQLIGRQCVKKMTRCAIVEHGCHWLSASRDDHNKQRELQSTVFVSLKISFIENISLMTLL